MNNLDYIESMMTMKEAQKSFVDKGVGLKPKLFLPNFQAIHKLLSRLSEDTQDNSIQWGC